ncbi:hypothetical protein [Thermococcus sp.]|uniref:hypothetical protein n=1 Tax=Thermococcus sp. TaxID=35749 RepID=UPI0026186902|nr:hypothetical protein [Thermococcus sp.]
MILPISLAKVGYFEKALEIAKEAKGYSKSRDFPTLFAFIQIAKELGDAGYYDKAIKVFEEALDIATKSGVPMDLDFVMGHMAVFLAKFGHFERAIKMAKEIQDDGALSRIAVLLAKTGHLEKALEIIKNSTKNIENTQEKQRAITLKL